MSELSYISSCSKKILTSEQQQIKLNLINALNKYKSNLADINNYQILLNSNLISDKKKNVIECKIKYLKLRLSYLDNLIEPLSLLDKNIIYYRFIERLTYRKILLKINRFSSVNTLHVHVIRLLDGLTLRTDPIIFQG